MSAAGNFDYASGNSLNASVQVPSGARVVTMAAHAPLSGDAYVTIGAGSVITVRAGTSWGEQVLPREFGQGPTSLALEGPLTVSFTGSVDSYYISWMIGG
jgi:hypothetical protein